MPLISTIEEFSAAYPMLESASIAQLSSFIELAEQSIFRDQVLGPTLFDSLLAAYEASIASTPVALSAPNAALLRKVRFALAYLVAHEAAPTLNVSHTSNGMQVNETTNSKPAHMWRVKEARTAMLRQAHGHLNQLINYLIANESAHPTWSAAPVRKEVRESLVPSMTVAERYLKLSGPWLLHHLRPALRSIQTGPVKTLLGATAYDALLAAVVANNPDATQLSYLEEIRPAMLHLAIAEQAVAMSLTIDEDGLWNWQAVSSGSAVSGGKQPVTDNRLTGLVRHHENKGKAHLEALRAILEPETPSSPGFPSGDTGSVFFGG